MTRRCVVEIQDMLNTVPIYNLAGMMAHVTRDDPFYKQLLHAMEPRYDSLRVHDGVDKLVEKIELLKAELGGREDL